MARPKKVIDPKKVQRLANIGCPPEEIAAALDCSVNTIQRHFGPGVQQGRLYCQQTVRSLLIKKAREGCVPVIIFLGKALLGLRENEPISINVAATGGSIALGVPEEQKKKIEQLANEIQQRAFMRFRQPQPEPATHNGDGANPDTTSTPALN